MGRLQATVRTHATSVLCALALVLVAFAHRPATVDPRLSDLQIAADAPFGASLADLCLSGGTEDDAAAFADCPACTLVKNMALAPACLALSGVGLAAQARVVRPDALILTGQGPRASPARGPPSSALI